MRFSFLQFRLTSILVAFLLSSVIVATHADAAVIFGLIYDPATTAGAGSNSNRAGAGTWHLYAVDNSAGNSGLSSFDVTLHTPSGTMAASNRAPQTNYDADGGGTSAHSGFTFLRQTLNNGTSTIELTGAQDTPPSANSSSNVGVDYYPISGFGQTASSFAAKYSNAILGPTTGSTWGNYTEPELTNAGFSGLAAVAGGNKWVLLGEGTYSGGPGNYPRFTAGTATVYTDFATTFLSSSAPTQFGTSPEPGAISLVAIALFACGLPTTRTGRSIAVA